METTSERLFIDPRFKASYEGVKNLFQEDRKVHRHISLPDVKNFLLKKHSYTLHKNLKRKYKKPKITASGIGTSAQCDLLDLSRFRQGNDDFAFVLVVIDVFSRLLHVEPLKNKSSKEVLRGVRSVFERWLTPWSVTSDRHYFSMKELQRFYDEHEIRHFERLSSLQIHCAIAENAIRQITAKLGRYFTGRKTHRWIDVIHALADGLNHRVCRKLGMAPAEVTLENSHLIRQKFSGSPICDTTVRKPQFKIGEHVCIEANKS